MKITLIISFLLFGWSGMYAQEVHKHTLLVHPQKTLTIIFPENIDSAFGGGFAQVKNGQAVSSGVADYVLSYTGKFLTLMVREKKEDEDSIPARNFSAVSGDNLYSFDCNPVTVRDDAMDTFAVGRSKPKIEAVDIEEVNKPPHRLKRGNPETWIRQLNRVVSLHSLVEQKSYEDLIGFLQGYAKINRDLLFGVHRGTVVDNYEYTVLPQMVIREKEYDSLAFYCIVQNASEKALVFDPEGVTVRVGKSIYRQATGLTDITPLQPSEERKIFFIIEGDENGDPTYLSPDNNFIISIDIVERLDTTEDLVK